jgi:hypothetical protein
MARMGVTVEAAEGFATRVRHTLQVGTVVVQMGFGAKADVQAATWDMHAC